MRLSHFRIYLVVIQVRGSDSKNSYSVVVWLNIFLASLMYLLQEVSIQPDFRKRRFFARSSHFEVLGTFSNWKSSWKMLLNSCMYVCMSVCIRVCKLLKTFRRFTERLKVPANFTGNRQKIKKSSINQVFLNNF